MKNKIVPIIQIPHPQLRAVARPVPTVDTAMLTLAQKLADTLKHTSNPVGVGLAAPQIDHSWRVFATQLDDQIELFFNPVITKHSQSVVLGEDEADPDLEGCLSIPKLYGPVPRWQWVELEFDQLLNRDAPDTARFQRASRRFADFPARVIQHEHDHLDGILFIDYCVQYDLPVYTADNRSEKMTLMPPELLATLHHSTLVQTQSSSAKPTANQTKE